MNAVTELNSRKILRHLGRRFKARGYVDAVSGRRVAGWAFAGSAVKVEATVGDMPIVSVIPDRERHDVASTFPGERHAQRSGFILDLPEAAIPAGEVVQVRLTARPASILHRATILTEISIAGSEVVAKLADAPGSGIVGPFPAPVIDAVAALWPDAAADLASPHGQRLFVEKLRVLLATPGLRSVPAIADYARYLKICWAHCQFVERYFPTDNPRAREGSVDFYCKPNSVPEIFAIVHQLYVLRSYGVSGAFAEFGCFKGFSSAMLSFACRQLGIEMHIFDSFEGLPASEGSGYAAGDYAGSLDEVTENVTQFGARDAVTFHKGFFCDTFQTYRPPELMCLWMDVDLESSANDLMVVADRLDPRATMFSHECEPGIFVDGEIIADRHPANPVPPMLDRFDELGRPLTGRFIRGNTGAFWPRAAGIPVLDNTVLLDLARNI